MKTLVPAGNIGKEGKCMKEIKGKTVLLRNIKESDIDDRYALGKIEGAFHSDIIMSILEDEWKSNNEREAGLI